jgi:hypothetical protein
MELRELFHGIDFSSFMLFMSFMVNKYTRARPWWAKPLRRHGPRFFRQQSLTGIYYTAHQILIFIE